MIDPADLRDVFDRAASLPPEDRAAFLARACGDNTALRQEIERLLAADARAASVFDSGSSGSDGDAERKPASRDATAALRVGARLGPYVIVGAAGHGGMGEVYRARDTRLDRTVALKVLPSDLVRDPAARRRFEREARAAAALSHPHICTLLDIGCQDETDFLVMEFVEGDTLADRLTREKLSLHQSLRIATEIADALEAAHASNIVHRDIKPGNVMLRSNGFVKVLDFGLAKLTPLTTNGKDTTRAPSTRAGLIVGTVAYMSPEQARGQDVDARTDVWSLGCVLYEMVAGRAPFVGTSTTDVLAAVLQSEPASLQAIDAGTPSELQRIVSKALKKDRNERYQTVRDLVIDLNVLRQSLVRSSDGITAATQRPSAVRRVRRWAIAAVTLAVAAFAAARIYRSTANEQTNLQVSATKELASVQLTAAPDPGTVSVRISPDGKFLAYSDSRGVVVRQLATSEEQLLPDTKEMGVASWSPDSTRLRLSGKQWLDVSLLGTRRPVPQGVPSPDQSRLVWFKESNGTFDGTRCRWGAEYRALCRIRDTPWRWNGVPTVGSWRLQQRQISPRVGATPEGRLELVRSSDVPARIDRLHARLRLWHRRPHYVARLDNPLRLVHGTRRLLEFLVRRGSSPKTGARAGDPRQLSHWPGGVELGELSATADGRRLVYVKAKTQGDVYIARFKGAGPSIDTPQRLTLDDLGEAPTAWSADGRSVVFQTDDRGIFSQAIDSNLPKPLRDETGEIRGPNTTPDGRWVLFLSRATGDPMQLGAFPLLEDPGDGHGDPELHVLPDADCARAAFCVERDGNDDVISDLDPIRGRGRELFRKQRVRAIQLCRPIDLGWPLWSAPRITRFASRRWRACWSERFMCLARKSFSALSAGTRRATASSLRALMPATLSCSSCRWAERSHVMYRTSSFPLRMGHSLR